ncbi:MAG: MFS transporter [Acidimicrobiia bacterium]
MGSEARAGRTAGSAILVILSAAMFIYVIDTTIMNVSISDVVADLDTEVTKVQAAITVYTLTMSAFMLTGGKLGDRWGSLRAFRIGLVVYGIGTVTTALAANIAMLIIGWSILEGLGSALIVPAINTLIRTNFPGDARARAYGVVWGVAAAGAAFGPIVGGAITTAATWRLAFALEAVIVVVVLIGSGKLADSRPDEPVDLDYVGVLLSVVGLGLVVLGVLRTSTAGWDDVATWVMIGAGLAVLGLFVVWLRHRERTGTSPLLHLSIFRHRSIREGLPVLATQTFMQAGILFLVPLFCQSLLGFNAFRTGVTLLPLSIAVLGVSSLSPPLGHRFYPRSIVAGGLVVLAVGGVLLSRSLDGAESGWDLALPLAVIGVGIGLVVAQLPNLILSGADNDEASEAAGLQGTSQNLGMALGTAVVGSVILSVGFAAVADEVDSSTVLADDTRARVEATIDAGTQSVTNEKVEDFAAGLPAEEGDEIRRIARDSQLDGYQAALLAGAAVALLGFVLALRLPKRKLGGDRLEESARAGSKAIPTFDLEVRDLATEGPGESTDDDAGSETGDQTRDRTREDPTP